MNEKTNITFIAVGNYFRATSGLIHYNLYEDEHCGLWVVSFAFRGITVEDEIAMSPTFEEAATIANKHFAELRESVMGMK